MNKKTKFDAKPTDEELGGWIAAALSQTGFPFEHRVFEQVRAKGWNCHPNRLYLDSDERKTREMDLLCFKRTKAPEVNGCTVLIVSCKMRFGKPWVMLTRKRAGTMAPVPPINVWSNHVALQYESARSAWTAEYLDSARAGDLEVWGSDGDYEVFAIQELEAKQAGGGFRPIGDSSAYGATMTLLKALSYEMASLQARRAADKEKRAYQFNLIQLVDNDMFEARYDSAVPTVTRRHRFRYYAHTMLDGKPISSRIDFCTSAKLPELLEEMDSVHAFNTAYFDARAKRFYESIEEHPDRLDALKDDFAGRLAYRLKVFGNLEEASSDLLYGLRYDEGDEVLVLILKTDSEIVEKLSANEKLRPSITRILTTVYRYKGEFRLTSWDDEIPF